VTAQRWVWVPFEVDKKFDGYRIDRFLTQRLIGYSRSKIQAILEEARVLKGDLSDPGATKGKVISVRINPGKHSHDMDCRMK